MGGKGEDTHLEGMKSEGSEVRGSGLNPQHFLPCDQEQMTPAFSSTFSPLQNGAEAAIVKLGDEASLVFISSSIKSESQGLYGDPEGT